MARTSGAMYDWHVFSSAAGCRPLWSRFPVEIDVGERAPLIVTPHLFAWGSRAPAGGDVYSCASTPAVAFCARGGRAGFLREEVLPKLHGRVEQVALVEPERERVTLMSSGEEFPLAEVPAVMERMFGVKLAAHSDLGALANPADREREWFSWAPPAYGPEAEDHPIRLWEALFWRGHTWRYELVDGEVPLVADLGGEPAAAATLGQVMSDAEALIQEPRRVDGEWQRCGPVRGRQLGPVVELRVRLTGADVRVSFGPQTRMAGAERLPTIFGALVAGGDNGKTEMIDGWTWSTAMLDTPEEAEQAARAWSEVIEAWVGIEVERCDGYPRRTAQNPDAWYVRTYKRYTTLHVPVHRHDLLPWRVLSS